jgi:hypothetical protein
MEPIPPPPRPLRQPSLPLSATSGPADLWNGLTEHQRLECRQVLSQMLIAVARHVPNAMRDHPDSHAHHSE